MEKEYKTCGGGDEFFGFQGTTNSVGVLDVTCQRDILKEIHGKSTFSFFTSLFDSRNLRTIEVDHKVPYNDRVDQVRP
ncbi:hypothetical protein HPP92_006240 [Vanilla planifolia]|uniref:Uncharacterized protein n=1 Tax=Vanilla planifolia TaxID=51239 RepID=A0A835RN78_VANPL|nr:hypothetical protein HPP92_006240 [Vanilla planifolia]